MRNTFTIMVCVAIARVLFLGLIDHTSLHSSCRILIVFRFFSWISIWENVQISIRQNFTNNLILSSVTFPCPFYCLDYQIPTTNATFVLSLYNYCSLIAFGSVSVFGHFLPSGWPVSTLRVLYRAGEMLRLGHPIHRCRCSCRTSFANRQSKPSQTPFQPIHPTIQFQLCNQHHRHCLRCCPRICSCLHSGHTGVGTLVALACSHPPTRPVHCFSNFSSILVPILVPTAQHHAAAVVIAVVALYRPNIAAISAAATAASAAATAIPAALRCRCALGTCTSRFTGSVHRT